ncbi:mitochondrial ribosomal protein l48 [Holotrichia oblita]|uniref:Mitochondrial ribosomal protein l48 n=2 Tax=Holotrichia oblita TaxID=644536 RepID=A0ACB9T774_HOLOL|nr:mitochondrial ribosomal protein l48 [Holotrichia oblita]KAI4462689.1 mitochondrial ribosomal protein l48 [Holotrichia oblita]
MNQIRRICQHSKYIYLNSIRLYSQDLYEPDYLEAMKSKIPLYDTLNIQIKGYDYPVLESFQKIIHSLAKNMDINVDDAWALPHQDLNIITYKPNSEIIDHQYGLKVFRRTVQVTDVSSIQLPLFIRAIETATPAGVTINIVNHAEHYEEERYIPDKELLTLKQSLEDQGGSKKK